MNELYEKLSDASLRIENMILLAGAIADVYSVAPSLSELMDYDFDKETIRRLFPSAPDHVVTAEGDDMQWQMVEWMIDTDTLGYLVQFATPVMRRITKTGRVFSWGSYYTEWIYAETLDQAIVSGVAWAEKMRAKEDEKASVKGTP